MTVETYIHRGKQWMRSRMAEPEVRKFLRRAVWAGGGLLLSAVELLGFPQPVILGLLSVCRGPRLWTTALGAALGYALRDGGTGPGLCWVVLGLFTSILSRKWRVCREQKHLVPALLGFWAALSGIVWGLLKFPVPTVGYLLSVAAAPLSYCLFRALEEKQDPLPVWIGQGLLVLALSQILPRPGPGILAAGVLALGQGFPGAALGGIALDLGRVSPVSMTAVVCLIWMTRMIPGMKESWRNFLPGGVYLLVMELSGSRDLSPLPAFALSGAAAWLMPARPELKLRRGGTGLAQVRLEVMAGVLTQTREVLLEQRESPIDEDALLSKTRERACGGCPNRKQCPRLGAIPRELLHIAWTENQTLPFPCRKPGRMILELRRTQEQFRRLRAERDRQSEYRRAVVQQYGFLAEYLRSQADQLSRRGDGTSIRFRVLAASASRGREEDNGDRFVQFPGPSGQHFALLCDGMGTGPGAAGESEQAAALLQRMLTAGFPPEHALESLNSLMTLGDGCAAVTVDLLQLRLDTGKALLYKWGAPESVLLRNGAAEKIGTAGPPPGIGVSDIRMTVQRLSLGRGEALILLSDGVDAQRLIRCAAAAPGLPPGEMAAKFLELSTAEPRDDATVAVIRLGSL